MKCDGTMLAIVLLNAANLAWLFGSGEIWCILRIVMELFR